MQAGTTSSSEASQYLTFVLGAEHYGIEILCVQEIRGFAPVTPLPNAPSYVRGVINLRGTIVPVVDLREKLGLPSRDYDRFTVVVVTTVGTRVVGLIVDAVSDVMSFTDDAIQPSPDIGSGRPESVTRGIARHEERLVMLLDLEHVLSDSGISGDAGVESAPEAG